MSAILLRTTIATLVAFAGGALGVALGRVARERLNLLVYAATGALLAVTVFDILPDARAALSWPAFGLATVSGYLLFLVIDRTVYHLCPSCALSTFDEETTRRLGRTTAMLMVALGIHSAMDGIAVVVGDRLIGHANLGVLFAVSFHKLPEGLALAVLLIGAGYPRRTALVRTLGIEATTELGGLIGVLTLQHASLPWLGLLFGHVGGGFLYLIVSTLRTFNAGAAQGGSARALIASCGLSFLGTALLMLHFAR